MESGYFDFAQVMVYLFWIFFAGLILYIRKEDKREGYPLESDRRNVVVQGWPAMAPDKEARQPHPALHIWEARSAATVAASSAATGSPIVATSPAAPAKPAPPTSTEEQ